MSSQQLRKHLVLIMFFIWASLINPAWASGIESGYIMIIDVSREMYASANSAKDKNKIIHFVNRVAVQPGFPGSKHQTNKTNGDFKEATISQLVVRDEHGNILHEESLVYPVLITVPPPMPGMGPDSVPAAIPVDSPKTTLVIPYYSDAHSLSIMEGGTEVFHDLNMISTARAQFNQQKSVMPPPPESAPSEPGFLNILIIASGYDNTNMWKFEAKAAEVKNVFLSQNPFASRLSKTRINAYKNTGSLGCSNGCFNIDRLLCCDSSKVVSGAASSGFPYDEIIVIHNTNTYSGGGARESGTAYKNNSAITYCQVYDGDSTAVMALHEFGHSFGNLCDEYSYGSEGYTYSECVNCRASCKDWSDASASCQSGCDAAQSFFRPEDSIMLTLSLQSFNQPTLKATFSPDGLEKRFDFFAATTGSSYVLTLNSAGSGSGTVSGGGNYAAGAMVNLTATANAGSTFAGWSPTPCAASFTMPASALTCTATFNQTSQILSAAVGVFRNGQWFLDANGNGAWDGCGTEFCFSGFGQSGDLPASGNWDGGSKSYIGVLRSGTGEWFIDRNGNRQWDGCGVDGCYVGFGAPGDWPVAGDWHGTGFAKIGVFRNGQWYLDASGNGQWDGCSADSCLSFGQAGDLPVAGNWDGGVPAGVGVFRAGTWYLDYNGNGVWDGCGVDRCYFNSFGQAGDLPAAGDWNGDGKAKVGVFRAGTWYLDYNGNGAWDGCSVDRCYFGSFGQQGDWPVAGKW